MSLFHIQKNSIKLFVHHQVNTSMNQSKTLYTRQCTDKIIKVIIHNKNLDFKK